MKDKIKKRIVLVGVLLLTGLVLAGIGNVLGAGELVQGIVNEFTAKDKIVLEGNKAMIYENGKISFVQGEVDPPPEEDEDDVVDRIVAAYVDELEGRVQPQQEIPEELSHLRDLARRNNERMRRGEITPEEQQQFLQREIIPGLREHLDRVLRIGEYTEEQPTPQDQQNPTRSYVHAFALHLTAWKFLHMGLFVPVSLLNPYFKDEEK